MEPPASAGDDNVPSQDTDGATKPKKQGSTLRELFLLIIVALVLALLIKTFLAQAFLIPSSSMEPTLRIGDRVLVDKLTPWFGARPQRGQVVVFRDSGGWLPPTPPAPSNPVGDAVKKVLVFVGLLPSDSEQNLVKRIIGVGGDVVECTAHDELLVNGTPLDEPYVFTGNPKCLTAQTGPFKVTVPQEQLWVMGDHRNASADSRFHRNRNNGMVPADDVIGRAFFVVWPISHWRSLPVPATFEQKALATPFSPSLSYTQGLVGTVPTHCAATAKTAGPEKPGSDATFGHCW